jgi:methyl-accepting chemotaxis protein
LQACPLFIEIAGKIGELIAEISAPSQEQSQGIQRVSEAMVKMDKMVQ